MKIKLLTISFLMLSGTTLFAQQAFDKSNARDGENVEYCTQHKKMNELAIKDPARYQLYLQEQQANAGKPNTTDSEKSGIVYTIPVVFHVLHQNGLENISLEQLQSAIDVLNIDYRKLNADANNVHADFTGLPADAEIEFVLATKAPNGDCFRGVTRTLTPLTFDGSDGQDQVDAVVAGNDIYNGQWAPNKYLNIYVCDEIGGAAGYTFNPGGWTGSSMFYNGIFVLHNYTGDMGTSSNYTSRTLTHEVGHWLNLSHTWGSNNNPGNASSCSSDDAVTDTPNTIGVTSCNLNENSCGPRANVENYMDYSYCSKMFTPGQVTRMRNAITSSTAGRSNLWKAANLTLVGAGETILCHAEFSADKNVICSGDNVQFTDESYNSVSGWSWSFPGGSPATSTAQNPSVTYSAPGVYTVTLVATDGGPGQTETKTSYITVLDPPSTLPFWEGFESYTTLLGINEWSTLNPGNNAKWEVTNTASHTGSKSVKLANFGQPAEGVDELLAASVDLSGQSASNTTLSFRFAYRRRTSGDYEKLSVHFSDDCGASWLQKKTLAGSALGTTVVGSAWTPTASDWVTVHVTNFTANFMTSNFRYKFKFESDNGNNVYIDDINIYAGAPSDEIVTTVGLEENEELGNMNVYPNPGAGEVNLSFDVNYGQTVQVSFTDVTGKVVNSQIVNAATGKNIVMMDASTLSKGMYFVTLTSETSQKSIQFIKN